MTTGFIGIGSMGMAMAVNLLRKGQALCVYDIRDEALVKARGHGIPVCDNAADVAAQSDLIIIVVVNAKQIDAVLFSDDARVARAAAGKTVMICSTIAPEDTEAIAAKLATFGVAMLDTPISGGPARAEAGTMSIMLAGDEATIARHQTVLDALSDKIFQLGPRIGDGARYKLVNNLAAGINLVGAAEVIALGIRLGLDKHKLLALMSASSGQSMMLEDRMTRALQDDFAPRAHAHILTKDVALGCAMAQPTGQEMAMSKRALEVLKATLACGYEDLDDGVVLKILL